MLITIQICDHPIRFSSAAARTGRRNEARDAGLPANRGKIGTGAKK